MEFDFVFLDLFIFGKLFKCKIVREVLRKKCSVRVFLGGDKIRK